MARHPTVTRGKRALIVPATLLLLLAAFTGAGCGLFGSNEVETPAIPSTTSQATDASGPRSSNGPAFDTLVQPAPGSWAKAEFVPGVPIDWRHGLFFTDNITGRTQAISVVAAPQKRPDPASTPNPNGMSQEPQVVQYSLGGEARWAWTTVHGLDRGFLLNREKFEAWSWDWKLLGLQAASRDYLLFERATGPDTTLHRTGNFIVADQELQVVSEFDLPQSWFAPAPFVSGNGMAAIWVAERDESTRKLSYRLNLVDLRTGTSREIFDITFDLLGKDFEQSAFLRSEASDESIVVKILSPNPSPGVIERIPTAAQELTFNWRGERIQERSDPGALLSPDGQHMVYETFLRFEGSGGGEGGGQRWPAVTVAKADGTELFRIRSASLTYGDGLPEERWLADGSGFLVMIESGAPEPGPTHDRLGFAIVRLDGTIEPLPALPAMPEPRRWFERTMNRGPSPHPTDANLLAFGHFELLNLATRTWIGSPYVRADDGPMHLGPWVDGERVFALPHGGHGGWGPPVLLKAVVERPPSSNSLAMVVADGGCLNMREAPDLTSRVVTCLPPATRLELAELPQGVEPGTQAAFEASTVRYTESGTWLKVTQGGWVNSAFMHWAD